MVAIPTLFTEQLCLRPFNADDFEPWALMCADPAVMRYLGDGQPLDRRGSWRLLALMLGHWALRGYGQWALELRTDGSFVGRAGLWQPEGWPGLEAGWALAACFWGQGFATEAGQATLQFAWDQLDAAEVISIIRPDNFASQRVAKRLRMQLQQDTTLRDREVLIFSRQRPTA